MRPKSFFFLASYTGFRKGVVAFLLLLLWFCQELSSAPFRERIQRAIVKGREFLEAELNRGRFPHSAFPMGIRSLYLYALLESGADPRDPLIVETLERVSRLPLRATYSVSLHLLSLCSWSFAKAEVPLLDPKGSLSELSFFGRYTYRAEELANWLLAARRRSSGQWSYGPVEERFHDNSNTQFAVAALDRAARMGVVFPRSVFRQVAETFAGTILETGSRSPVRLSMEVWDFPASARLGLSPKRRLVTLRNVPAGWGYRRGEVPTFSMTCAGLSNLGICLFQLKRLEKEDRSLESQINEAIEKACLWLAIRWEDLRSLRPAPGKAKRRYYYNVYSLEKAADLVGVSRFGSHNWYQEEASFLLEDQRPDGGWGRDGWEGVATSFALLFLSRASDPRRPIQELFHPVSPALAKARRDVVFLGEFRGGVSLGALLLACYLRRDAPTYSLALRALGSLPERDQPLALPTLIAFAQERANSLRRFAFRGLSLITGENSSDLEVYREWYQIWRKLDSLRGSRKGKRLFELLAEADKRNFEKLLVVLLRRIGESGDPGAIEEVLPFLESKDSEVRQTASDCVYALTGGRFGQKKLYSLPESKALKVRVSAFLQSGGARELVKQKVEESLRKILESKDLGYDKKAMEILNRYRSVTFSVILKLLDSELIDRRIFFLLRQLTGKDLGVDPAVWRKELSRRLAR